MNRRGFVGILAGLAGAMGLRGQSGAGKVVGGPPAGLVTPSQSPFPACKTPQAAYRWEDGKWTCYEADPAKGEEYCPLGHAQKPKYRYLLIPGDKPGAMAIDTDCVCSVCGVVYCRQEELKK